MGKTEGYSVKREIKDAVMELMAEKPYMDFTVTDIVTRARVARASFYRDFNSINDVIDAISDELSEEMIEDISHRSSSVTTKERGGNSCSIISTGSPCGRIR